MGPNPGGDSGPRTPSEVESLLNERRRGPCSQSNRASCARTRSSFMCGIVGYVGPRSVTDVLVPGLARLEYRGYDSAGVALHHGDSLAVVKRAGRMDELADAIAAAPPRE